MQVTVCIITYLRPEGLGRLLAGLNRLTFEHSEPDLRIVVVDNDPGRSAHRICQRIGAALRWPLAYFVEPQRGIPYARNTAVAHIGYGTDLVAFIDDDEVPESGWLDELLHAQRRYEADVVVGAVVPRFSPGAPDWIRKGSFFQATRWTTGRRLNRGYTSNALVSFSLLRAQSARFDERMALSGGSDAHFFKRALAIGCKIVYTDEAIVHEWIPTTRANAPWILRRAFRIGTSTAFIQYDLRYTFIAVGLLLAIGSFRVLKGAFFFSLLAPFGQRWRVTYLRHVYYGAGLLAGLAGARYDEYRTIHGD